MSQDNKKRLTRFIEEVWSQGNIDATDGYLAAHYTLHHDPGDPWDGQTLDIEGYKERVRLSRATFPDQRFTLEELVAEQSRIATAWRWCSTHKLDIPGFPASGRSITMSGLTIYYFDGARLSGHWQIVDRLSVYQQLTG